MSKVVRPTSIITSTSNNNSSNNNNNNTTTLSTIQTTGNIATGDQRSASCAAFFSTRQQHQFEKLHYPQQQHNQQHHQPKPPTATSKFKTVKTPVGSQEIPVDLLPLPAPLSSPPPPQPQPPPQPLLPLPLAPLNTQTKTSGSNQVDVNGNTTAPVNQQAAYKGAECLARRRQLSRWLRQVSSDGIENQLAEFNCIKLDNNNNTHNNTNCNKQQQEQVSPFGSNTTNTCNYEYDQLSEPEDNYSRPGDELSLRQSFKPHHQTAITANNKNDKKKKKNYLQLKQATLINSLTWQPVIKTSSRGFNNSSSNNNNFTINYQSENNVSQQQNLVPVSPTKRKSISSSLSQLVLSSTSSLSLKQHYQNQNQNQNQQQQVNCNNTYSSTMATVRPISPQYQHALDSAISLAKELASRNMADSGESSPKTPNSPDKKRFNFKFKYFSKSFSEASANIRDIESSISYEAKMAYKSLVERGPFNSYHHHNQVDPMSSFNHHNQHHSYHHHSHTLGSPHHHHHNSNSYNNHHLHQNDSIRSHRHHNSHHSHHQYANDLDDFSPTFTNPHNKLKHVNASTFSVKKSIF